MAAATNAANTRLKLVRNEAPCPRSSDLDLQRAVFDTLPTSVAIVDPDGTIVLVNRPWQRFALANGLRDAGFGVGANYLDVCDRAAGECPEAADVAAGLRAVLRGEQPSFGLEYECAEPGKTSWFRMRAMRTATPGFESAVVLHYDVTERRTAEAASATWKDRYDLALRAGGHILYDWDPIANVATTGGAYEQVLGYRPEEMADALEGWLALVHPDDRAGLLDGLQRALAGKAPVVLEYRVRRKDGTYAVVRDEGHVVTGAAGEVVRLIGLVTDVTDRKGVEEERDHFFSQSRDLLCIGTLDGRVTRVNAAWERTLGFTNDEAMRTSVAALVHPDDRKATGDALARLLVHAEVTLENRCRCKDGSYRWIEWSLTSAIDRGLVYATGRDVTERRHAEAAREEEAHRWKALAEELQRANRVKSEFMSTMSHELRTPINVALGYLEMLGDDLPPEERAVVLGRVREANLQLLALAESALAVDPIAAGVDRTTLSPVDVQELWAELGEALGTRPEAARVALHWAPVDGVTIATDRRKLAMILTNLVGNALKFTPAGRVDVGCVQADGATTFTVRDTGIGIAAEHLDLVFEMFRQVDGSDARRYGGAGLGLYVVKTLVEQLGGIVDVESEVGRGSTFRVTLPVAAPD